MFYHPEIIVYLWLIPVFLTLCLPLLASPLLILGSRLIAAKSLATGQKRVIRQNQKLDHEAFEENRVHSRLAVEGVVAHISDGSNCCEGAVRDISKHGIRLVNPKGTINKNADKLGVLLTGNGISVPMQVKPKWNQESGPELNIGASIDDELWNWNEFRETSRNSNSAGAAV